MTNEQQEAATTPQETTNETPPSTELTVEERRQRALETQQAREVLWSMTAEATFNLKVMPLGGLRALADALAKSDLVPKALIDRPVNVFAVLLKGAELGLSAMTSVAEVMVIQGKLVLSAHLQNALVLRSGKAKIFRVTESTKQKAVVEVQRVDWGNPTLIEFTIEEAAALGLTTKGRDENARMANPWVTQPANMLRRRAITRAAREFFGDVVTAYDPDEIEIDESATTPAPPVWTAVPSDQMPSWADDPAPSKPKEKTTPAAMPTAEVSSMMKRFTEAVSAAKDRSALDRAFDIVAPISKAADAGDPEARALMKDIGDIHGKQAAELNKARQRRG